MTAIKSAAATRPMVQAAIIAFIWGLAEATIFFLVPDVYLTRVALRNLRRALLGCLFATAGALIGGAALWTAAHRGHAPALLHTYLWVPGINNTIIAAAGQGVQHNGAMAMVAGVISGRPYKLYAVHAGAQDVPLAAFLLLSLLVRLGRFLITSILAWLIGVALAKAPNNILFRIHLLLWVAFYAVYFAVMR